MSKLNICYAPNPILRKKSTKIEKITPEIKKLISDMFETMYDSDGVGLAAPQVGINKQLVVLDISHKGEEGSKKEKKVLINPKITNMSDEKEKGEEGCLSLPGIFYEVLRSKEIAFEYTNEDGKVIKSKANGFLACALQHEIDHLNGVLFIDHLSKLKQNIAMKKLKKIKKGLGIDE